MKGGISKVNNKTYFDITPFYVIYCIYKNILIKLNTFI